MPRISHWGSSGRTGLMAGGIRLLAADIAVSAAAAQARRDIRVKMAAATSVDRRGYGARRTMRTKTMIFGAIDFP